jgi:hypothetical protein
MHNIVENTQKKKYLNYLINILTTILPKKKKKKNKDINHILVHGFVIPCLVTYYSPNLE